MTTLGFFGSLLLAAVTFVLGKLLSQSEKLIEQKKIAYRDFLAACPTIADATQIGPEALGNLIAERVVPHQGVLSLYASGEALERCSYFLQTIQNASDSGEEGDLSKDPSYIEAAHAYNRMIYDMRRDVMRWSFFALRKQPKEGFPSPLNLHGK